MTKTVVVHSQQKWEYFLETGRTEQSLLIKINEHGQQGWELVEVLYYKDIKAVMTWAAFLKRPSAGVAPKPGEETAILAKPVSHASPEEKAPVLQGFDLNGSEFSFKAEEPVHEPASAGPPLSGK